MKPQIPWLRVFVEGVVIVGSILLAFGIDAAWEERAEQRAELELLSSILESVEASEAGLIAALDRLSGDESRVSWFFNAAATELAAVPRDSMDNFGAALFRPNTFEIMRGPLSGVLNTAQASLIRESQVRAALNQWLAEATELDQMNQTLTQLGEMGSVALARHDVVRSFWFNGVEGLPPTVDLNPVRNDDELMAVAASVTQRRGIQRFFSQRLLGSLDALRQSVLPLLH